MFPEDMIEHAIVGVLAAIGDYIVIPVCNWVDGWDIFKYRPKFALRRESRRQSCRLLEDGLALLRSGSAQEADVRFGAALKLNPQLVRTLSKKQRQSLIDGLERQGGDANATRLWLDLRSSPTGSLPGGYS